MAGPRDGSAQWLENAHNRAHRRGLAGSVPPDQTHELALADGKGKLVYSDPLAETLVQFRDLKH